MKRAILWIIVIIIVVGGGIFRIVRKNITKRTLQISVNKTVPVKVAVVKKGTIEDVVLYSGIIEGEVQAGIFSEVPGRLLKFTVKEGDWVRKDETVAVVERSVTGMEFKPTIVKAPISGIVGIFTVNVGDVVRPDRPIGIVGKTQRVRVKINIPDKEYPLILGAKKARIYVDAYPDTVFEGIIKKRAKFANPYTAAIPLDIIIDNSKGLLIPGMFAEVHLVRKTEKDVIVVPIDVVLGRLKDRYVYIVKDGVAKKVPVRIGIVGDNEIEITDGVVEGDSLIIVGQKVVMDGDMVTVVKNKGKTHNTYEKE